jgi:hypothetical protein
MSRKATGTAIRPVSMRGNRVWMITRFGDRGLFARFGLPRTLPRD